MFLSRHLSAQSQPSFLPQAISFPSLWSFAVWGRPGRSSDVRWKERGWFPTIIIPVLHQPIPSILNHKWYWSAALWMLSPPALGWAFQERVFRFFIGHCLPSAYLTSPHRTRSTRPFPPYLQILQDWKWERPGTRLESTYGRVNASELEAENPLYTRECMCNVCFTQQNMVAAHTKCDEYAIGWYVQLLHYTLNCLMLRCSATMVLQFANLEAHKNK